MSMPIYKVVGSYYFLIISSVVIECCLYSYVVDRRFIISILNLFDQRTVGALKALSKINKLILKFNLDLLIGYLFYYPPTKSNSIEHEGLCRIKPKSNIS